MERKHQNEVNPCISQGMWNALKKKSNTQRAAKRKCIIVDAQENAVQRWISQSWVRMCVFSSEEVTSGTYITCSILTYMWLTRVVGFCHLHGILNFKPGMQKLLLLLVRTILVKGHGQWTAFLWLQALCLVNCRELQVWILVSALWLSLEFLDYQDLVLDIWVPCKVIWHLQSDPVKHNNTTEIKILLLSSVQSLSVEKTCSSVRVERSDFLLTFVPAQRSQPLTPFHQTFIRFLQREVATVYLWALVSRCCLKRPWLPQSLMSNCFPEE